MSEIELVFGGIQTAAAVAALGEIFLEKRRLRAKRFLDALSFDDRERERDTFVQLLRSQALMSFAEQSEAECEAVLNATDAVVECST